MYRKGSTEITKAKELRKVANFFRKYPYITIKDASENLSIPEETLRKYLRDLTNTLRKETLGLYEIHRTRLLKDIASVKEKCLKKLKMCRGAQAGSRWVEEWTKLTKQEIKMLGLYAPDKAIVAHVDSRESMTKEKRDAVVEAILIGDQEGVIKVGGTESESGDG